MKRALCANRGAGLAEYILLLAILSLGTATTVAVFGEDVAALFRHSARTVETDVADIPGAKLSPGPSKQDPGDISMPPGASEPGEADPDGSELPEKDGPDEGTGEIIASGSACNREGPLPAPPNYVDGDIVLLEFSGLQIARYDSMWGHGNQQDRLIYVNGIAPLGAADQIFTLRVWQTHGHTQMMNGMLADVLNPEGELIAGYFNLKPDEEQGLATGDEHMILTPINMVIDLNGLDPGDMTYGFVDEVGDPDWGDNDGDFDFDQTGCPS